MGNAVTSVEGFLRAIRSRRTDPDAHYFFRGHSDAKKYRLIPSLLRTDENLQREAELVRELICHHPADFASDTSTFDRLTRMQHYGLPTRLLDITMNALVGLYFATETLNKLSGHSSTTKDKEPSGDVFLFKVSRSSYKFFDSDTVSCLANLCHLTQRQKEELDGLQEKKRPGTCAAMDKLVQSIRQEKLYFEPEINPSDLRRVICVRPKLNSPRIIAQSGAFFLFGITGEMKAADPEVSYEKLTVAGSSKIKIRTELAQLGVHGGSLFPGLEKAAEHIRSVPAR